MVKSLLSRSPNDTTESWTLARRKNLEYRTPIFTVFFEFLFKKLFWSNLFVNRTRHHSYFCKNCLKHQKRCKKAQNITASTRDRSLTLFSENFIRFSPQPRNVNKLKLQVTTSKSKLELEIRSILTKWKIPRLCWRMTPPWCLIFTWRVKKCVWGACEGVKIRLTRSQRHKVCISSTVPKGTPFNGVNLKEKKKDFPKRYRKRDSPFFL